MLVMDHIMSATKRLLPAVAIAAASFSVFISSHCAAEPRSDSTDARPNIVCLKTLEISNATPRVICFARGLPIGARTELRSFGEQQQKLQEELQRRAEQRRGVVGTQP